MTEPDFTVHVRRLVSRTPPAVIEAMFVTADNHPEVGAWVRSKGNGWHTHGKWVGPGYGGGPGLGISPDGSGDRTSSVEDGQWLLYGPFGLSHHFFHLDTKNLEAWYVDADEKNPLETRIADLEWVLSGAIVAFRDLRMDSEPDESLRLRVVHMLRSALGRPEDHFDPNEQHIRVTRILTEDEAVAAVHERWDRMRSGTKETRP